MTSVNKNGLTPRAEKRLKRFITKAAEDISKAAENALPRKRVDAFRYRQFVDEMREGVGEVRSFALSFITTEAFAQEGVRPICEKIDEKIATISKRRDSWLNEIKANIFEAIKDEIDRIRTKFEKIQWEEDTKQNEDEQRVPKAKEETMEKMDLTERLAKVMEVEKGQLPGHIGQMTMQISRQTTKTLLSRLEESSLSFEEMKELSDLFPQLECHAKQMAQQAIINVGTIADEQEFWQTYIDLLQTFSLKNTVLNDFFQTQLAPSLFEDLELVESSKDYLSLNSSTEGDFSEAEYEIQLQILLQKLQIYEEKKRVRKLFSRISPQEVSWRAQALEENFLELSRGTKEDLHKVVSIFLRSMLHLIQELSEENFELGKDIHHFLVAENCAVYPDTLAKLVLEKVAEPFVEALKCNSIENAFHSLQGDKNNYGETALQGAAIVFIASLLRIKGVEMNRMLRFYRKGKEGIGQHMKSLSWEDGKSETETSFDAFLVLEIDQFLEELGQLRVDKALPPEKGEGSESIYRLISVQPEGKSRENPVLSEPGQSPVSSGADNVSPQELQSSMELTILLPSPQSAFQEPDPPQNPIVHEPVQTSEVEGSVIEPLSSPNKTQEPDLNTQDLSEESEFPESKRPEIQLPFQGEKLSLSGPSSFEEIKPSEGGDDSPKPDLSEDVHHEEKARPSGEPAAVADSAFPLKAMEPLGKSSPEIYLIPSHPEDPGSSYSLFGEFKDILHEPEKITQPQKTIPQAEVADQVLESPPQERLNPQAEMQAFIEMRRLQINQELAMLTRLEMTLRETEDVKQEPVSPNPLEGDKLQVLQEELGRLEGEVHLQLEQHQASTEQMQTLMEEGVEICEMIERGLETCETLSEEILESTGSVHSIVARGQEPTEVERDLIQDFLNNFQNLENSLKELQNTGQEEFSLEERIRSVRRRFDKWNQFIKSDLLKRYDSSNLAKLFPEQATLLKVEIEAFLALETLINQWSQAQRRLNGFIRDLELPYHNKQEAEILLKEYSTQGPSLKKPSSPTPPEVRATSEFKEKEVMEETMEVEFNGEILRCSRIGLYGVAVLEALAKIDERYGLLGRNAQVIASFIKCSLGELFPQDEKELAARVERDLKTLSIPVEGTNKIGRETRGSIQRPIIQFWRGKIQKKDPTTNEQNSEDRPMIFVASSTADQFLKLPSLSINLSEAEFERLREAAAQKKTRNKDLAEKIKRK